MDYSCGFGPGFGGSLRRGGNIRKSLSVSSKYIGGADYVLRTQLAEQLKCMDAKWEMDSVYLNDLLEFYRKRAVLEQEYADALNKLVQNTKQKLNTESTKRQNWPKYSYHSLLTVLLDSTIQTAVAHQVAAEVFSRQMTQRLQDLLEDCTRAHKQSRELAQLCQATVLSTTAKLNSTYREYCNAYQLAEDAKKTLEKSKEKFDRERKRAHDKNKDIDKSHKIKKLKEDFNQKCDYNAKHNIQTLQSRNEYIIQIVASNASVDKYFGQEIFDLLNCLNLGFHNSIVRAGLNHISCEKSLANTHRSTAQMIEKLVQTIDPNRDQLKFLNNNQSAFNKNCSFTFQTIKDDVITCVMSHPSLLDMFHSAIDHLAESINESKQKFEEYWSMSNESTKKLHKLIDLRDYDVEDVFTKSIISHSKNGSRNNLDSISNRLNEAQSYLHLRSNTRQNRIELEKQYFEQFSAFIIENHHFHVLNSKLDSLKTALSDGNQVLPPSLNNNTTTRHSMRIDASVGMATIPGSSGGSSSSSSGSCEKENSIRIFGGTLEEYVKITQQSIPPLISSTIQIISIYGIHVQGIFRISGSQAEMNELKELYENLQDPLYNSQSIIDVNVAAGLLKMYFRELKEPIFSGPLFHRIVELYETERERESFIEKVSEVLLDLSADSYVVMRYLFGFLRHLTTRKDENMMDSYNLAICLGPCLMPIPVELNKVLFHMQAIVNEIIRLFIENHHLVFQNHHHHHGPIYEPPPAPPSLASNNNTPPTVTMEDSRDMTSSYTGEYDEAHSTLTSHRTKCSIDGSDTLEGSGASDSSCSPGEMKQLDSPPYLAVAIADFTGQTESELSFNKDDNLILEDFVSDHWWQGRISTNQGSSREGLIPLAYIQVISQLDEISPTSNNEDSPFSNEQASNTTHTQDGARSTTPIAILQVNHHDPAESHYLHIRPNIPSNSTTALPDNSYHVNNNINVTSVSTTRLPSNSTSSLTTVPMVGNQAPLNSVRSKSPSPDIQPPNAFSDRSHNRSGAVAMTNPSNHMIFSPNIEHQPWSDKNLVSQSNLSSSLQMLSSFGYATPAAIPSSHNAAHIFIQQQQQHQHQQQYHMSASTELSNTNRTLSSQSSNTSTQSSHTASSPSQTTNTSHGAPPTTPTTTPVSDRPLLSHMSSDDASTSNNSETDIDLVLANVLQGLASIQSQSKPHLLRETELLEQQDLVEAAALEDAAQAESISMKSSTTTDSGESTSHDKPNNSTIRRKTSNTNIE